MVIEGGAAEAPAVVEAAAPPAGVSYAWNSESYAPRGSLDAWAALDVSSCR
jgi:hypothetical protein